MSNGVTPGDNLQATLPPSSPSIDSPLEQVTGPSFVAPNTKIETSSDIPWGPIHLGDPGEDAIFGRVQEFKRLKALHDANVKAGTAEVADAPINLVVGITLNSDLKLQPYESVTRAKAIIDGRIARGEIDANYLPTSGYPPFVNGLLSKLLGKEHSALANGTIAAVQTIGGTGSLSTALNQIRIETEARFRDRLQDLRKKKASASVETDLRSILSPENLSVLTDIFLALPNLYVDSKTWVNHLKISDDKDFVVGRIMVLPTTRKIGEAERNTIFNAILEHYAQLPDYSVILKQGCCTNPHGVDWTPAEWDRFIELCTKKRFTVLLDLAYALYGEGLEQDTYSLRKLFASDVHTLAAISCSKMFDAYDKRLGLLAEHLPSWMLKEHERRGNDPKSLVKNVQKTLADINIRANISNAVGPSAHVVAEILNTDLWNLHLEEAKTRRESRMTSMRTGLVEEMKRINPDVANLFSYFTDQKGFFSSIMSGTQEEETAAAKRLDRFGLVTAGTRISFPGVAPKDLPRIAKGIVDFFLAEHASGQRWAIALAGHRG